VAGVVVVKPVRAAAVACEIAKLVEDGVLEKISKPTRYRKARTVDRLF